jgi:hypothetical protein
MPMNYAIMHRRCGPVQQQVCKRLSGGLHDNACCEIERNALAHQAKILGGLKSRAVSIPFTWVSTASHQGGNEEPDLTYKEENFHASTSIKPQRGLKGIR